MHKRLLLATFFLLASCSPMVADNSDNITQEIGNANYCETDQDCQLVQNSKCPFGCYIYVNEREVSKIEGMLSAYNSQCTYSCIDSKGVECKENKCVVILT